MDEQEKNGIMQQMNHYRDTIESYELFVGSLNIHIPPMINDQLSQIVLNLA